MRGAIRRGGVGGWANKKRSSGGAFLSGWKREGRIRVWLHTGAEPLDVYRHSLPQVIVTKDKVAHVWSKNFVCHEAEEVLESQYFREEGPDSLRKAPPERCGICKLVEWAHQQCFLFWNTNGKKGIDWLTPLFRFDGDNDPDGRPVSEVLLAGGITNLFKKAYDGKLEVEGRDLKEEMRAAKIRFGRNGGVWSQNAYAKLNTLFVVVDHDHPDKGAQITFEAQGLGDKMRETIGKCQKRLGEEKGDPLLHPYAFEWEYHAEEQEFGKKYDATDMPAIKPTPQVLRLIRGDAPDTREATSPFNQLTVRANLEKHCLLKPGTVPWDELFPSRDQLARWAEEDREDAAKDEALAREAAAHGKDAAAEQDDDKIEVDEDGDEVVMCDACEKPMKVALPKCPHCDKDYEVTAEGKEPAKAAPSREATKLAGPGPKKTVGKKAPPPPEDDDECPF